MSVLTFVSQLFAPAISQEAIRSEIYFLGDRHRGDALKGAREELKAPHLHADRERLLRAVVSHLQRETRRGA